MRPGDLIFVEGRGLVATLIKWVTKSKYSHVAVYVGDGKVIEAQGFRRVGFQALSFYSGQYDIQPLPRSVTHEGLCAGMHWLLLQRGRPYSYWDDFVILLRCLFGINLPWHEGVSIICSRLARDFCFQCGLPVPDENMSPEDLWEWIESYKEA
jgi:cell wall-associated NlpC family hydrolase